jgi:prolipoprotein diacylglyceryltransferase
MSGGYVHNIDPVFADLAGVHLWWYGLGFALGFFEIQSYLLRHHLRLGLSKREVWALSTVIAIGVLAGGRAVEVAFDEWPFYRKNPTLIPWFWLVF